MKKLLPLLLLTIALLVPQYAFAGTLSDGCSAYTCPSGQDYYWQGGTGDCYIEINDVNADCTTPATVPTNYHRSFSCSAGCSTAADTKKDWVYDYGTEDLTYAYGNVGIGISSPVDELHIHAGVGEAYSPWIRMTNDNTGGMSNDGARMGIRSDGNFEIQQFEAGKHILLVNANVGIGTSDPGDKLEVNAGAVDGGITIFTSDADDASATLTLKNSVGITSKFTSHESHGSSSGLKIHAGVGSSAGSGARNMYFYNGDTLGMMLDSYGDLKLGASGFSGKLAVIGDVNFVNTRLIVASTSQSKPINYATGAGDVWVEDALEVDGSAYFDGYIYDSDDTGYYVNPASTTKLSILNVDNGATISKASTGNSIIVFDNTGSTDGGDVLSIRNTDWVDTASSYHIKFYEDDGGLDDFTGGIKSSGENDILFVATSDARLKTNIRDYTDGLDILMNVKAREFDWIENGEGSVGFIAQELQPFYPYAVSGSPDSNPQLDPMVVDYGRITPLLVSAIQEQQSIIDELTSRIEELEK